VNYNLMEALGQIAREKGLDKAVVVEKAQAALLSAARRKYGPESKLDARIDEDTGSIRIFVTMTVVEDVEDPTRQISLEQAGEISKDAEIGQELEIELPLEEFGRTAIQTVRQVFIQGVREEERENIYKEYKDRVGELVSVVVQQVDRGNVYVKLDKAEAILPGRELLPGDRYRQGDHLRACIIAVEKATKGPQIVLSRSRQEFLIKLFEAEVSEVAEGIVEIKCVAREPGFRSKISVMSHDEKVDAVGACVGVKGSRVQSVVRELGGERIDIIPWSSDPVVLVSRALSPAKVLEVEADKEEQRVCVVVADDQLSLAIGKSGQNARLAAKLTNWKIDLMSQSEHQRQLEFEKAMKIEVSEMPGVGAKTAERLMKAGFETVQDVAGSSVEKLQEVQGIGKKTAEKLFEQARGLWKQKLEETSALDKIEGVPAAQASPDGSVKLKSREEKTEEAKDAEETEASEKTEEGEEVNEQLTSEQPRES